MGKSYPGRLARKRFDKFTSEISTCYENNMKSSLRSYYETKSFPVTEISLVPIVSATFQINSIDVQCYVTAETLPGKRDNFSPYEQNKSIWLVEKFSR